MSRLNLEAFKAQTEIQTQELEALSGGILGACHTTESSGCTHLNGEGLFYSAYHLLFECKD